MKKQRLNHSNIAYFDCFSGASGDMIIGALLDAGLAFEDLKNEIEKLNLPDLELKVRPVLKRHISATKFDVIDRAEKTYRHLSDLTRIVEAAELSEKIKTAAVAIFERIAQTEARIHGQSIEKVHFHEIGAVDTIVDVVGALAGFELLQIDKIYCSKLNVGAGFVEFSHGKFPVPAPATAELLKGIPIYSSGVGGELVTPTGAAILSQAVSEFGDMPTITPAQIGYGAGEKEFDQPNVLRVFIGTQQSALDAEYDIVSVIETNIDDMNPQIYETVFTNLLQAGALDVLLTSVMMKKNRPGNLLTVLCHPPYERACIQLIFEETSAIGIRIRQEKRVKLRREIESIETELGKVRIKISRLNDEILNRTPEYEDCKRIAQQEGIPLKEVIARVSAIIQKQ